MTNRSAEIGAAIGVLLLSMLAGCGGGAGGPRPGRAVLSGAVSDADGKPVAGAQVQCAGRTTTSLSTGSFVITDVPSGFQLVEASLDVNGHWWSGETVADLADGERNRTVCVMVSDERFHGSVAGSVTDTGGRPLAGAKVFAGGPWGSAMAVADSWGRYELRRLAPGFTYTIAASLAGYLNESLQVPVTSSATSNRSFSLSTGTAGGPMPGATGTNAVAWTIADSVSRAATGSVYDRLRRHYRRMRGLPDGPQARSVELVGRSRSTPRGSVIEVDLFWQHEYWEDLLGYAIRRSSAGGPRETIAVLRDPLAAVFFDVDPDLTPDTQYRYTVHRLDTIAFPRDGSVGDASAEMVANPLKPIRATAPVGGQSASTAPLLEWSPVSGATQYQVVVWEYFPDLQNASDPDGVPMLWPADLTNPGSSLVTAPQTAVRYAGPALRSGRTYYWLVIADDGTGEAYSASKIERFAVR